MTEALSPRRLYERFQEGSPRTAEVDASLALVQRYFDMWNTGDGATADVLLGPSYLDHATPAVIGPAAARSLVRRFHAMNPDARMAIEVVAAGAEYVAVRRGIRSVRDGAAGARGMALFRVADGRLAEQWSWSPSVRREAAPRSRDIWERAHRQLRDDDAHGCKVYEPVAIHETDDPEVIVVELELGGEDAAGKTYRLPYVQIVRVRDGRIDLLRDYFDSLAVAERSSSNGEATGTPSIRA